MSRPRRNGSLDNAAMFADMTSRWNPFPNANGSLGSYDYFSQTISLRSVDGPLLEAAIRGKEFPARLKVIPLLAHETQHFADHVSTLWGRELLIRLFEVYTARQSDSLEGYERIPEMMRELRTLDYADYYTEYPDLAFEAWDRQRWRYQFSTGVQLDATGRGREDRPIVFTRFARQSDNALICRVPFSVVSLLEVRAMAAEMFAAMVLFQKGGTDPVETMVDQKNWEERMSGMFYDGTLALYSVAAHCFANRLGLSDPLETYTKSSAVAWLCLNLPRSMFPSLRIPPGFATWGPRNEAMRANADRGYLYLALIENGRGLDTKDMDGWLDEALRRSELPPLGEVLKAMDEEREAAIGRKTNGPFGQRLEELLALGREYVAKETLHPGRAYVFGAAPVPPFLVSDGRFVRITGTPTTGTFADPDEWFRYSHHLYSRVREFVDACVY